MNVVYRQQGPCRDVMKEYSGHLELSMCSSCRASGGSASGEEVLCRFRHLRVVTCDETSNHFNVGYEDTSNTIDPELTLVYDRWHTRDILATKKLVCAELLLPIYKTELRLLDLNPIPRRREVDIRVTCDKCGTELFGSGWFCTRCAREYCNLCASPAQDRKVDRLCHSNSKMLLLSRFSRNELSMAITEMEELLNRQPKLSSHGRDRQLVSMRKEELTLDRFRELWSNHAPLVVRGVHLDFQVTWTPEYFIHRYGAQSCEVEDCETGEAIPDYTVRKFFEKFGQRHMPGDAILRLKDWPPKEDFDAVFPDLLDDFIKVVPVPDYCAPKGVLNLASHFPRNFVKPDLGPKSYNAYTSVLDDAHSGSTRLHLDVADAVNIMTYAGITAQGSRGFATWHIFARDDSDTIRQYLQARQTKKRVKGDPIHNQDTYITPVMLAELRVQYGVRSYTVVQYPGDAVFIPAGCAHQVLNQADCMKIACDFISPESATECLRIAGELRQQRLTVPSFPEELLPVKSMLHYTWQTLPLLEEALLRRHADMVAARGDVLDPVSGGSTGGGTPNSDVHCHPHGVHGPFPTAGFVREREQHAQQKEASISRCNLRKADHETTTGNNGVLGDSYQLSVEASSSGVMKTSRSIAPDPKRPFECPICMQSTPMNRLAKKWRFAEGEGLISHAIAVHAHKMSKKERRSYVQINLSPALLAEALFHSTVSSVRGPQ